MKFTYMEIGNNLGLETNFNKEIIKNKKKKQKKKIGVKHNWKNWNLYNNA